MTGVAANRIKKNSLPGVRLAELIAQIGRAFSFFHQKAVAGPAEEA
jgi:hypothetical protein